MSAVGSKASVQKAEDHREGLMEIIDFELNFEGLGKFFFSMFDYENFQSCSKVEMFTVNTAYLLPVLYN